MPFVSSATSFGPIALPFVTPATPLGPSALQFVRLPRHPAFERLSGPGTRAGSSALLFWRMVDQSWDVFVSYAHADDEPPMGAAKGWVTTLADELRKMLRRKLGVCEARLFMDHHAQDPHHPGPLLPTAPFPRPGRRGRAARNGLACLPRASVRGCPEEAWYQLIRAAFNECRAKYAPSQNAPGGPRYPWLRSRSLPRLEQPESRRHPRPSDQQSGDRFSWLGPRDRQPSTWPLGRGPLTGRRKSRAAPVRPPRTRPP